MDLTKYVKRVKTNHRLRGFRINILQDDMIPLIQKTLDEGCPIPGCGKPVQLNSCGDVGYNPSGISADIIDPSMKVLCKENVHFICQECNRRKGNMSLEVYAQLCGEGVRGMTEEEFLELVDE